MGTILLSNPEPIKNMSKNNYGWSSVFDVALIRKQKLKHSYNKTLFIKQDWRSFFEIPLWDWRSFKEADKNYVHA